MFFTSPASTATAMAIAEGSVLPDPDDFQLPEAKMFMELITRIIEMITNS